MMNIINISRNKRSKKKIEWIYVILVMEILMVYILISLIKIGNLWDSISGQVQSLYIIILSRLEISIVLLWITKTTKKKII